MWLELNKKVDAFKLRTEAMKHHIAFVPGKIFSSGNNYTNFIRLSFSKPWSDDVEYALMMLGRLIRKMI
jgi:DNA-binding transcriptional MocR family regulator